jgi:hypothetical protein
VAEAATLCRTTSYSVVIHLQADIDLTGASFVR